MISGQLKHAQRYYSVHPRLQKAFEWLMTEDLASKAPGAYEIQGKEIVALVQEYETAPANVAPWETHNYHLDVQYLVSGEEKIGYGRRENVVPTQAYNQKDDYDLIKAVPGDYYSIKDDGFMILFPEDAHQPHVAAGDKGMKVKKICIKVLV